MLVLGTRTFLDKCANDLRFLPKEIQLADGLTKKNGLSQDLMQVLQTGRFQLEGGWEVKKHAGIFSRTWLDMNRDSVTERHAVWAGVTFSPSD